MSEKPVMTLSDIARLANVSESTVSRALRNNPVVNQTTRERVQKIAREHNFKINAAARNLRLQRTNTVAVIIMFDQASGQSISDPFLLEIVGTIADQLARHDYDMLLTNTHASHSDWNNYYLQSNRADGLIIVGQGDDEAPLKALTAKNIPFVVWGSHQASTDYTVIGSDNAEGARRAVAHLIEQGCRSIVFLGDQRHIDVKQRFIGYQQALTQAEISLDDSLAISTDFTSADGYKQVQALLAKGVLFDAIFAVSDAIALGAMKCLQASQRRIPEDVAIVGFDDVSLAEYFSPSLSTIRQQTQLGAKHLVDAVLKKINKQVVPSARLSTELVIRESSRRIKVNQE